MSDTFGTFIRNKRVNSNKTLRQFCKESSYDVGYISRLENDLMTPPTEQDKLERLAITYGLETGSEDWETFQNLASVSLRQIPKEIDQRVLNYLPAFFRKASKKDVTTQDVEELVRLIKGE